MAIQHIAIHIIKREQNGDPLFVKLRESVNPLSGLSGELASQLLGLFDEANLNKGEFGVDGDNNVEPVFEQKLNSYYTQELEITNFIGLTRELARSYRSILDYNAAIKGGYLVYYQYIKSSDKYLGIAIVPREEGFDITDTDADVIESNLLELSKLHLGATINLSRWKLGIDTRYISFKTGQAKEIRDYFENYIGCQRDKRAIKIETRKLRDAVRQQAKNIGLNDIQAQDRVDTAYAHIQQRIKDKEPILLSIIANAVFPENPQGFVTKANNDFDLSEELTIDTGELKRYKKLAGNTKNINVSFDRSMLGDTVIYDPADPMDEGSKDFLHISAIPNTLKQAILEELAIRAEEGHEQQEN
ncbi:nucleoid-associated protein [Alteromonadaceae bacterium M269]|nr:nucleoid-associated protein [Alteromonadaceae bacterium M269]